MADNAQSKARNQAFLRQLEQQRLNKDCSRIIDLRGKVAGECQAYEFGGLTHYLDDRAYLLAKQLLDRFKGRYTNGVNEALLKALKSLPAQQDATAKSHADTAPILLRDKTAVQTISFDQLLQRKEPRIAHITPVELRISDVLYHATTIDMTTSSIRIALKRAFTLSKGDVVTASFTELSSNQNASALSKVHYSILKIEHDELRTFAILIRKRSDDKAVTDWLDNWSQQHNTSEHLDHDNQLVNLASKYYVRLYTASINSPFFWLSQHDDNTQVESFSLANSAQNIFEPLSSPEHITDFSLLPFTSAPQQQSLLIFIFEKEGKTQHFVISIDTPSAIANAFAWRNRVKDCSVFYMQTQAISLDLSSLEQQIERLAKISEQDTNTLLERLKSINYLASVTDITASCQYTRSQASGDALDTISSAKSHPSWLGSMPKPEPVQPFLKPESTRYFIRTKVKFTLLGSDFSQKTTDMSVTHLCLTLAGHYDVDVDTKVRINFYHWQSQTKSVKLAAVPYVIKNVQLWQGSTILELERTVSACAESINRFFVSAMERSKDQLAENVSRTFVSQQAYVFNDQLSQSSPHIPLYFGMDEDNKRILQAIASNANNNIDQPELWLALQQHVTMLSEQLKTAIDKGENAIQFGLYCYLDSRANWHITTDYEFSSSASKSRFISQALNGEQYYFFHCAITSLKPAILEQQADLNQQLLGLRSHSGHKVKLIREVLHSLFAIGELTNITPLFEALNQSQQ